jgi:lipoate-protein ligase A
LAHGKKLVGSAQKRTTNAVLQHGSIPLDDSFRRLPEFLLLSREERARQRILLEKKCACINEIIPSIDFDKLSACLIKGFTDVLSVPAVNKSWNEEELDRISVFTKMQ